MGASANRINRTPKTLDHVECRLRGNAFPAPPRESRAVYKTMPRDMREQGKIPVCELKGGRCLAPLEALKRAANSRPARATVEWSLDPPVRLICSGRTWDATPGRLPAALW
jgi:hypothetical protein